MGGREKKEAEREGGVGEGGHTQLMDNPLDGVVEEGWLGKEDAE